MDKICFFQINRLGKFCVSTALHLPDGGNLLFFLKPLSQRGRKGISAYQRKSHPISQTEKGYQKQTQYTYRASSHNAPPFLLLLLFFFPIYNNVFFFFIETVQRHFFPEGSFLVGMVG